MKKTNVMKTRGFKAASKRVMVRAWELKKQDSSYVWSLCLKMAWVEEKAGQLIKSKKSNTTKATKASDVAVEIQIANITMLISNNELDSTKLFDCKREVLIGVMKALHVKKWYRIYDKETMVTSIVNKAAA